MPPRYEVLMWGLRVMWGLLIFAYGACLGSLINVIVYRLPLGQSIVSPPSRCPSCQTRLTWRDNIPVLGWIFLKGKCRYCGTKISKEYPIVESIVGILFVVLLAYFYLIPSLTYGRATFLGVDWVREWYRNEPSQTWPTFVVLLILMASMVAMTIIDARTFTIPQLLTTAPVVVALIVHPLHAGVVGLLPHRSGTIPHRQFGWVWAIATPHLFRWDWIMASIGGVLGLILATALVRMRWLPQSFSDYAEWEESVRKVPAPVSGTSDSGAALADPGPPGAASDTPSTVPPTAAGPVTGDPADLWIQYPHARREVVKELLFLAPCLGLGVAGLYFGRWYWSVTYSPLSDMWTSPSKTPIWLVVLCGVLLGYLIGGGIVWAVRILGSLAFGKEAMGLGDVHLMAAVGACLGWIDSGLAFMGAAFVGLFWFVLGTAFSGTLKRTMPYGPYLAVSTLLVVLCKPLIEAGLGRLTGQPVSIP